MYTCAPSASTSQIKSVNRSVSRLLLRILAFVIAVGVPSASQPWCAVVPVRRDGELPRYAQGAYERGDALNALHFRTGTQSKHFMLVIATNRPEDLDTAVTDPIDGAIHFDLPEASELVWLLQMLFREYGGHMATAAVPASSDAAAKTTSSVGPLDLAAAMAQYGATMDGMSGREIAKMMLYFQSIVYTPNEDVVTPALVHRVVWEKVDEHKRNPKLKHCKDTS